MSRFQEVPVPDGGSCFLVILFVIIFGFIIFMNFGPYGELDKHDFIVELANGQRVMIKAHSFYLNDGDIVWENYSIEKIEQRERIPVGEWKSVTLKTDKYFVTEIESSTSER